MLRSDMGTPSPTWTFARRKVDNDQLRGNPGSGPARRRLLTLSLTLGESLEVHHRARRDSRAIGPAARRIQADIVDLRTERKVRQHLDIYAAAEAVGKL